MIVCEIGLNHLGDESYADHYIKSLLASKIDAISFQVREPAFYDREGFASLKLQREYYSKVAERIRIGGKMLGISLADIREISFFEDIGVSFYKVLSMDLLNFPLFDKLITKSTKPIYVSTGMSDLEEIEKFYDYTKTERNRFRLIHTQLAGSIEHVNLEAINFLKKKFDLPVAYGHHCSNLNVIYMALVYQPSDIFVFVKGKWSITHPDEAHAIQLEKLSSVALELNKLPKAIGRGIKVKMENRIERQFRMSLC